MKLRKLTYWCCSQEHDSPCYNIRARTRKEANALREAQWNKEKYSKPFKVVAEFKDTFDLIDQAMGEGGLCEYAPERKK